MTDPSNSLLDVWNQVVEDLYALAEDPNSDVPQLTPRQRAYLRLTQPITQVSGYAILAVPHEHAKNALESDLREFINLVLSSKLGKPCRITVSVDPHLQHQTPEEKPQQPKHPDPAASTPVPTASTRAWREDTHPQGQFRFEDYEAPKPQARWQETHAPSPEERPAPAPAPQPKSKSGTASAPSLNPKYTFETFVIAQSNRFAAAAARAVSENPAEAYNPLFVYGGSGLGKTHLLHAVGNYAHVLQPGLRIKYVSSEEFTNDFINSVSDNDRDSFKRRYRNLDILMVDDIQFLQGKETTQEEFFHTFNTLYQANKQIILASDRPPNQLTTLEDRLRTRFEAGLLTDIQPPDLETRIAILDAKARVDGYAIDHSVLELIASRYRSSVRELEGALLRVTAYSSLNKMPIDVHLVEQIMPEIIQGATELEINPVTILEATAEYFGFTLDVLRGSSRVHAIVHARQLAMYLCRELTDLSLPKIGELFNGKNHTTVMYADKKIRQEMPKKRETYDEIQELTTIIKNRGMGR